MNSFSLSKLFTAVLFVLVGSSTWAATASDKEAGKAQCTKECGNVEDYASECPGLEDSKLANCKIDALKSCRKECADDKKNDAKTCTDAMKEWRDKSSAGTRACGAFDKAIGKSCSERAEACKSKIDGTFKGGGESNDESLGIIKQLVMAKLGSSSDAIANDVATGGVACVKSYDAKTKKENEKEFTKEKRELEARVKKEKDEQTKQNEKLREKKDEITKKITDLDGKLKKSAEARAKNTSDAAAAYQKKVVDSGKIIRSIGTAILQEQQKLTKARFGIQTSLLELTDDKILNRCKQQLLSVRNALVTNAPASATSATDAQIKGVKDLIGTGAKGTVNLNAYLKQIKEACFQQENTKKQQLQLQYTQDSEAANARIEEFQKSISDENVTLKAAKDANDTAAKQADTEKTNEETQKAADAANLNTELQNFQDSINEKIKNSKEEAVKVTTEIQDLTLKKDFDVAPAYDEAEDAMTKAENARISAVKSCDCSNTSNEECTMLDKAATNPTPGKSSGKSTPRTGK